MLTSCNIFDMPCWAYVPAVIMASVIAFLTLVILSRTNLRDWAIFFLTGTSFSIYFICTLYVTHIILY